jgi:hypothetical protein
MPIKYKSNPSKKAAPQLFWRTYKGLTPEQSLLSFAEKTPKGMRAWIVGFDGLHGETKGSKWAKPSPWLKSEYKPATKAQIAKVTPSSEYEPDDDDLEDNPARVGLSQPDLFTSFGDTAPYVALEDLSEDQIRALPRKAFSEDEWDELEEDTQEWIYEHDKESKERVETLAKNIVEYVESSRDLDSVLERSEGDIDYFFEDEDRLWENHGEFIRDWAEENLGEGYDEDELKQAAIDVGLTQHNSEFTATTGGGDVAASCDGFYLDSSGLDYMMHGEPEEYTLDELARAIEKAEEKDESYDGPTVSDQSLEPQEFWDLIHGTPNRWRRTGRATWDYPEISRDSCYDYYSLVVEWNEEEILNDIRESIDFEPGRPREAYVELAPTERIAATLELSDGAYNIIDLIPGELAKETKKMNHCVGKRQYGYGAKIQEGRIRILSVRPVSGGSIWKRTFTLELNISPPDNTSTINELIDESTTSSIESIEQVKGTRNRLPGFAKPGYAGEGQMARATTEDFAGPAEWLNMVEVLDYLGFDPDAVPDMRPGLRAHELLEEPQENPPQAYYLDVEWPMQTFDMPSGEYEE